jgi:hypothetical protein
LTVRCVATPTGLAGSVFAPEEPDSYALADFPSGDTGTGLLNAANSLVARNTRIYYAGELAFNGTCVRVTHTASLNADAHLSSTGDGNLSFDQGENAR